VSLGAPGWRRTDEGPWQPLPFGGGAGAPAGDWFLPGGEESGLREFFMAIERADPPQHVAWARDRFEMGCERPSEAESLSDYLLALRALLDATSDAGEASLALRVAVLCAEEGRRRLVQRRIESAMALERFVMGGGPRTWPSGDSPIELVAEVEGHLRALLRDVLCGYLDSELKGVADDILLETSSEPFMEIEARDLRGREPEPEGEPEPVEAPEPVEEPELRDREQDTAELEALTLEPEPEPEPEPRPERERRPEPQPVAVESEPVTFEPDLEPVAVQRQLDGVTQSADWGFDDPEDYSAPV
jgi:hypothetical protein